MLSINIQDVMNVLDLITPYLIAIACAFVAALVLVIAFHFVFKKKKAKRRLLRKTTWVCFALAAVVLINVILTGPMSSMITLVTNGGTIDEETSAEATDLVEEISGEGIVLLKNEDSELPLESGKKLNVFGWASTNPCYGGTGSGSLSDSYPTVTLLQGLTDAGFELNTELSDFYTAYRADRPEVGMFAQDWTLPEPPVSTYSDELIQNAKDFSDTAVIVITRVGGEGSDLPTDVSKVTYTNNSDEYNDFEAGEHYLQLSQTEEDLVDMVCSNFDDVIVIYNGANAMELGWVNDYEEIKSVLYVPGVGQNGFDALGKILNGEINPSGKTADTFVADLTTAPSWNNFGDYQFDNADEFAYTSYNFMTQQTDTTYPHFVNYTEGIYVGYRYWETAADEGLIDYDESVVYPFGYGLTYTSFEQTMGEITDEDGNISFEVTVTNTGDVAGKDVVEVYYNPPYTNGGIEKASANLIAFEKTDTLEPGESETLSISFTEEDMASYDDLVSGCYVLEEGDYIISINSDSHNIIDSQTVTVDEDIVYDEDNKRSTDQVAAVNQFDGSRGDETYLSRKDHFANASEALAAPSSYSMTDEEKETYLQTSNYNPEDYNDPDDEMPTTGAKNGVELADLRGKDYDDPLWDDLLDELSVDDMDKLISIGGYQTSSVSSIKKVMTNDCDGPASVNDNFTGVGSVGFPCATLIACTWSKEEALKFGECIGKMADEMNVSGWYAPAVNTHRSAFGGRNFEYYSEDGVLSGYMAANAIQGAKEYGVYSYVKHFALNDQETNRYGRICTFVTEQSLREIYLKPFEIAIKDGGAQAVMSAYTYVGTVWSSGNYALCTTVLRDEWGFNGEVSTDYFLSSGFMNADQAVRAGTDTCLVTYDTEGNHVTDTTSATGVKAMRKASHDVLYTVVNSRAYDPENLNTGLLTWQKILIAVDVLIAALLALRMFFAVKKYRKDLEKEKAVQNS